MEASTFGPVTDWNEVIKKEARGLNDADLGEVQEVDDNYVLTQRGTISREKFYLPKSIPHGFNGRVLLFDITEEEAKEKFIKKPVKETKTVEVELTHEELIIEKRSPTTAAAEDKTTVTPSPSSTTTPAASSSSKEIMQSRTEINIPLKREDVVVSKKPYVKEEIVIKKKSVTETKTITEQVTSEEVSVRNANGEEVIEEVKK
jgi:stress response protein YsnF